MLLTTLTALLLSTSGINAATLAQRLDSIPLSIYTGPGCNDGPAVSTAYVPTDGSCFGISVVLSGTTDSGLISPLNLARLPAGCSPT
ncbi:hypothetical protein ACEQ8H_002103 [Pleosporales sp. CAS-2024a]